MLALKVSSMIACDNSYKDSVKMSCVKQYFMIHDVMHKKIVCMNSISDPGGPMVEW